MANNFMKNYIIDLHKEEKLLAIKDPRQFLANKKTFGHILLKQYNNFKMNNIKQILRVHAQIRECSYFNNLINQTVIKFINVEVKKPEQFNAEMKDRNKNYIKHFLGSLKKIEQISLQKKLMQEQREEEELVNELK